MFQRLLIGLTCVAAMAGSASAQAAKNNKLVRVTYPVADLVVPIPEYSKRDRDKEPELTKEALAQRLKQTITQSVAPRTWESNGGRGRIQYFPVGMAIVVEQRADVQEQIAKLLEDLRRLQDVQISVETRFVCCSERGAKSIWQHLDEHGQGVRVHQADSSLDNTDQARRMRSLDAKQLLAMLGDVQSHRATNLMHPPKITMFNGQKVILSAGEQTAKRELRDGFQCELLSVVESHNKTVRLSMDLEFTGTFTAELRQNVKASATVSVASERTLVWHLGTAKDRHLFVVMTPRMVVVDEQRILAGETKPVPQPARPALPALRGEAEEQTIPEQKKSDTKAIEKRLRQPISLNFKEVPLQQALKDLSILTGVVIVPDVVALNEARVNLDTPISIAVDNVDMQQALKLMFNPLGLRYVINNEAILITTRERGSSFQAVIYKIADILDAGDKRATGAAIITLIEDTVARNSWESRDGRGTIQFLPREKTLTVRNQPQEVQEEIAMLLASLRKLYDLSVEVDVRVVQMSADAAKRWCTAMTERDDPLFAAMRLLENGDRVTTITQPRLKVLNGQQGTVEIGDQANGYKFEVLPVVTPDRKSVRLTMNIEYRTKDEARSVEHVMKASKRLEAPDGRTQVWDVGATASGHLFVLITPRVIDRSRQEERLFIGEIEPIPGR